MSTESKRTRDADLQDLLTGMEEELKSQQSQMRPTSKLKTSFGENVITQKA